MQINPVKFISNRNISEIQRKTPFYGNLQQDTVSFSGNSVSNIARSKRVEECTDIGLHIYDSLKSGKSRREIIPYLKGQFPDIEILPMERLKEVIHDAQNYGAFYHGTLSHNFTIDDKKVYLDVNNDTNNNYKNMLFAKEAAHEFTHVKQSGNNSYVIELVRQMSNGDSAYARAITALGGHLFKPFDNIIQANMCKYAFTNYTDLINCQKYGQILPRQADITKRQILNANQLQAPKNFNKKINQEFYTQFNKMISDFYENEYFADPDMKEFLTKKLSTKEDTEKLYQDLRTYCAYCANREKEAYTTESEVSRKILGTQNGLNIDVFPLYYEMLEEAFKDKSTKVPLKFK